MPGYYIVNSVNQLQPFESDVCSSLLKVFNDEHLIFIAFFTLNGLYVVIQINGDIPPVVGDRFTAEQMQHSFQVSQAICLHSTDKMKSPSVPSHQVVDDNFTAKFTGGIGFVIPVQPSEDVDHSTFKHLILTLVQLFECTQDIRLADFRKVIVFQ